MSVNVEVVRTAANTSTGTQDFTFSGFGTVKAAKIEVTLAVANDTPIARGFYSYGIVDGTSQYCASAMFEDNVSTPEWNVGAETGSNQAYTSNSKCVALLDALTPALVAVATFDSFVTDGVRINWTTAPSTAVLVKVTLLGGTSLSVYAGDFVSTDVADTATVIASVPFMADQLILVGNHRLTFDSFAWPHSVPNSSLSVGFVDNGATIKQCCLAQYGDCSQPLSEAAGQVSSLYAGFSVLANEGTEITDFTSSGFSAYTRGGFGSGTGNFIFFYLALKYDGQPHWVGVIDSPTSTGDISETSPGIRPLAFMQLCSGIEIVDTPRAQNGTGAGSFGSLTCTANDLFTSGFGHQHGVDPQNTESWTSDALRARLSTQSDLHVASFVSFDATGWTLDYSVVNATVRKWPTLVIGSPVARATNRNLQYAEVAGPTTSSSLIGMGALTFTATVGDTYLVIAAVAAGVAASPFDVGVDDLNNAGGTFVESLTISPRDTTNDMYSVPFIFPYTIELDEVGNFDMQLEGIPSAGNITMRQGCLAAFKLLECDVYNDPLNSGSNSSLTGTFEDVTGGAITIVETGEYLVLASAVVGKSELTANFDIRLSLNGTTFYGTQSMRAVAVTPVALPWAAMVKLTLTAGDVLTIQHRATTTGGTTTNYPCIVALRTNMLPAVLYAEDLADDTTTITTYIDKAGMATEFRTQAQPSLILSCARIRRGAGSVDASAQTTYDGTTIQESRNESVIGDGEAVHFAMDGLTPTAGDHQIKSQFRSEGSGISTARYSDAAVAVLCLQDSASVYIRGGSILGAQIL